MKVPELTRKVVGLLAVVVCAPLGAGLGLFAALFAIDQFVAGWLPSRWFSSSASDWVFGMGTEGSARNYVGLMVTGVGAYACFAAVGWGLAALRQRRR